MKRLTPVLWGAAALGWPAPALACPSCFSGGGSNNGAFLYGSILLMVVPLTAIGSLVYWAYRRAQAQARKPAPPER